MDCKFANSMNIAGFLLSKGINPHRTVGNNFWYCSPVRKEEHPSFKIDREKNLWYDFGTATGGTLIDLVCRMYSVDVPGALLILSGVNSGSAFSVSDRRKSPEPAAGIKLVQVGQLKSPVLHHYLVRRNINPYFATGYCMEVTYQAGQSEKPNFAIGFKNDRGGYELRNRYTKLSTSPKDITTLKGKNGSAVNIFEGFMDFLSALSYFKTKRPGCDTIILNGVGFVKRILDRLPGYSRINLYLDNDRAGVETADRILQIRPDAINRSQIIYPGFKDFNDFLTLTPRK